MKSNNPFFKTKSYTSRQEVQIDVKQNSARSAWGESMTVEGTMNKSFMLFTILVTSSAITWYLSNAGFPINFLTIGGAIVGLILVLVASFKPHLSGYLAPAYAFFEGLFIGGISIYFESMFPGIVMQAISATLVTFVICFLLYKFGIVKVNQTFRSVVIAATLAIVTYYIISFLLNITGLYTPVHYGNSMMSIGISVFVIIVAALNLFLDFDNIESGVLNQQPKYMEWFGAMGLMITLVWLYIEFLRLLSKLASRD
jgi:uncharacterized YccA/Bax inhibitor family protein